VADDDNENESNEPAEAEKPKPAAAPKLPPRVERALAKAREAARKDSARKEGRWLAILPVSLAIALMLLMMPRATEPDAVPLPRVDERALKRIVAADDARARSVAESALPSDVRNVGSAFRAINAAEANQSDEVVTSDAQRSLEVAVRALNPNPGVDEALLSLRAFQMTKFLEGVRHWEETGESTQELKELGGNFVGRTTDAGWILPNRRVLMNDVERRVAFKTVWNAFVGVDKKEAFALSLDEQRALYAFYFTHPHAPDVRRAALRVQRRDATTPDACTKVNAEERRQSEMWRADKIRKFAAIDPSYPTTYALGVAFYRAGRYDLSAEAFTAFIGAHPSGPYSLRARNHLKAALSAAP